LGKSSPSPPPVPTAKETGAAQSATNTSTAAAQAALNDVNQVTPYGTTTYNQSGYYTTPAGDTVPRYTQTTELDPQSQALLDQQRAVAAQQTGVLGQQTGVLGGQTDIQDFLINDRNGNSAPARNLAYQIAQQSENPINFDTNFSGTLNQSPEALNSRVTDALYGQQKSFLDPAWNLKQQQLQDQLSKQGISVGSDAYNNALKQLDSSRTQAYQSAADSSIGQGVQAQQALFGMAQSGQQENLREQQLRQQAPISLLQQIYGMQPQAPQTEQLPQQPISNPAQTGIAPTDFIGAQSAATNAAYQGYNAQVATQNANTGAEAGAATAIASAAAMAAIF
jgi:hypothetical protein